MEIATLKVGIDARGARTGAQRVERSMDRMGDSAKRAERQMRSVNKAGAATGMMARQVAQSIAAMGAALGTAGLGAAAARVNADFQETMATIRGVTGATDQAFSALNARARELGATTRFSASQAAEAILFLSRTGYSAEQAIASVADTLHLAAAGALELGEAADFASNIAQQFRIPAEGMTRVVDTLITVSNRANTDVRQLAEAMKYAGGTAGFLGIDIEEAAAAFGVMGDVGIQASMAGTSLRMALMKLTGPTQEGEKKLAEMGIAAEDLARTLTGQGLHAALTMLRDGLERTYGDDLAAKAQALNKITRITAVEGVMAMIGGLDKMATVTGQAATEVGAASSMMAVMDDTLAGAFRSLRSAVEELFLLIGDSANSGLQVFLEQATLVVRAIGGMEVGVNGVTKEAKQLADQITGVATAVGVVLGLQVAKWVLGITAAVATNPFGLMALGVAGLVVHLQSMRDDLVEVGDEQLRVGDLMQASWDVIAEKVYTVVNAITRVVGGWFGDLEGNFKWFVNRGIGLFLLLGQQIQWMFEDLGTTIADFFKDVEFEVRKSILLMLHGLMENDVIAKMFRGLDILAGVDVRQSINDASRTYSDDKATEEEQRSNRRFEDQARANRTLSLLNDDHLQLLFGGSAQATAQPQTNTSVFAEGGMFGDVGARAAEIAEAREQGAAQAAALHRDSQGSFFDGVAAYINQNVESTVEQIKLMGRQTQAEALKAAVDAMAAEMSEDGSDSGSPTPTGLSAALDEQAEKLGQARLQADEYERALARLRDQQRDVSEQGVELDRVMENFALSAINQTADAIADLALGAKDADEAFGSLLKSIAQMAVQMAVQQGLKAAFGGGFAKGAAFSGGSVVPFASGGVVSGPTMFPMSGGRTGLMGEAGPEAIMPLTRDSQGRLGVRGGGGGNVTINVSTPDANSFRRNERQIARRAARHMRREQEG